MKCCHTDWKNLTIFLFNEQEGDFALAKSNPCDNCCVRDCSTAEGVPKRP